MSSKQEEVKCVWMMGTPCSDEQATEVKLFSNQIKVPICKDHLEQHTHIMALAQNGYDVEQILNETHEYRKEQFLILQLSGIDLNKVEI